MSPAKQEKILVIITESKWQRKKTNKFNDRNHFVGISKKLVSKSAQKEQYRQAFSMASFYNYYY